MGAAYEKKRVVIWWIMVKVFKNGPSKICGRQPLKDWAVQIF